MCPSQQRQAFRASAVSLPVICLQIQYCAWLANLLHKTLRAHQFYFSLLSSNDAAEDASSSGTPTKKMIGVTHSLGRVKRRN